MYMFFLSSSVMVNRVATYKQLDSDLHKHAGLFMLVSQLIHALYNIIYNYTVYSESVVVQMP